RRWPRAVLLQRKTIRLNKLQSAELGEIRSRQFLPFRVRRRRPVLQQRPIGDSIVRGGRIREDLLVGEILYPSRLASEPGNRLGETMSPERVDGQRIFSRPQPHFRVLAMAQARDEISV